MNTKNMLDTKSLFIPEVPPIHKVKPLDLDNPQNLNTEACIRFVEYQIIREAIYDYKMLEKRGIVKNGKMIRPPRSHVEVLEYPNSHSIKHFLTWFYKDLEYWLSLTKIHLTANAIRRGLGFSN